MRLFNILPLAFISLMLTFSHISQAEYAEVNGINLYFNKDNDTCFIVDSNDNILFQVDSVTDGCGAYLECES